MAGSLHMSRKMLHNEYCKNYVVLFFIIFDCKNVTKINNTK